MISIFFLLLLGCEEGTPEILGEDKILNFSTKTRNVYGEYWTLKQPVATHTVLNLYVKDWDIQSKGFDDPEAQKSEYAPFLERYETEDFQEVEAQMKRENFVFTTPLQVISTETTQASEHHLGSVDVVSSEEGTFVVEASGVDVDKIRVEFAKPVYWGLGAAAQDFWGRYIERPHHRKVCIYGTGTVDLLYGLYDSQDRHLFGTVPQLKLSVDQESIDAQHLGGVVSIDVKEGFERAQLQLVPKNVFEEPLYEPLPSVELCSADDSFVTGISIFGWMSEEVTTEFQELSEGDLRAATEGFKNTKRRSSQRKFLKQTVKNKGHAVAGFMPDVTTKLPTFNVPITVTPVGGMVARIEDIAQSIDTMELFIKHSKSSLTVPSGTPVIVSFPHNKDHVVSLSAAGHQKEIAFLKGQPSDP